MTFISNRTKSSEDMKELLCSVGISPTWHRMQIADLVLSSHQHLCAENVYMLANATGKSVSRATIYNTLRLFVDHGLLREIIVVANRVFYDSNISHHHHFFDTKTGELTDIEENQLEILDVPEPPVGKTIAGVDIIIRLKSTG